MPTDNRLTAKDYLSAVAAWNLDDATAGVLIGVPSRMVRDWQDGQSVEASEEVFARMTMVAQIRTALDIYWSKPLAYQWISLPNVGHPYCGLTPVAYVAEHGWPGLYYLLRQIQAQAAGNY